MRVVRLVSSHNTASDQVCLPPISVAPYRLSLNVECVWPYAGGYNELAAVRVLPPTITLFSLIFSDDKER